jgi:hypothetical protein
MFFLGWGSGLQTWAPHRPGPFIPARMLQIDCDWWLCKEDIHHRGHVEYQWIFVFGGIDLSSSHLGTWRISGQ